MIAPSIVSIVWFLAMLGAAVLVRDAGRAVATTLWAGIGFVGTFPLALWLSPQPNWIGVLVGVVAMWRVIGGASARFAPILSGSISGLAASLMVAAGAPSTASVAVTVAVLLLASVLRPAAAGGAVATREHVLALIALATPLVGLLADMLFGWQSAAVLNQQEIEINAPSVPAWGLAIVGLALVVGVVRGLRTKQ